jgi:hypothetical protein
MKHIQYFFLLFFALTLSLSAQEKVILKQTYIKVKEGNNYAQDLTRKFSKLAQKRIDAGYQLGWHLWEVVDSPQSPFSHVIVEPMLISQLDNQMTWDSYNELRNDALPEMTNQDWRIFMEDVREKRTLVAESIFITVNEVKRDEDVSLPDDIGVINFMKVKDGKFKTYEALEAALYAKGLNKKGLRTGWSLAKRVDRYGKDLYWNYMTVDWYSKYSDYIKMMVSAPTWDANKDFSKLMDIRDLRESVVIKKVMMLD